MPAAAGPELAERDRMPEAPRLAGERRVSTVRTDRPPRRAGLLAVRGRGEHASPASGPRSDAPESLEPPVVAVLPAFPMPGGPLDDTGSQAAVPDQEPAGPEPAPEQPSRREVRAAAARES